MVKHCCSLTGVEGAAGAGVVETALMSNSEAMVMQCMKWMGCSSAVLQVEGCMKGRLERRHMKVEAVVVVAENLLHLWFD